MVITGNLYIYEKYDTFTCKFTNISYEKTKHMLRRYDFQIVPTHISEKLHFQKMKCTSNSLDIDTFSDLILTYLSKYWLKSVSNHANTAITEPHIRNINTLFLKMYRESVLRKLINKCVTYLQNINIKSFDVSPSQSSSVDEHYNIRIDLFNYDLQYSLSLNEPYSLKFVGKCTHRTAHEPTAFLIISSKNNSHDVIIIEVQSIEFDLTLEVNWINKVQKLNIIDVNVTIEKNNDQEYSSHILSLIKYSSVKLANEFKQYFIFLIDKIDFYSLNVL